MNYDMKKSFLIITVLLIFNLSKAQVPSSSRSIEAMRQRITTLTTKADSFVLRLGDPVFMRIFKESNELEVWIRNDTRYQLFKKYTICYYSGSLGTKTKTGDGQAPEGFYQIFPTSMNPNSDYHLSFNIGYPNAYDLVHRYTGSDIMVHGECVSIGCYAMGNDNIEEIWTIMVKAFEKGQRNIPLHIFPFRMTTENLQRNTDSTWAGFWMNLQEGYRHFENNHVPPMVVVSRGKYCFR